MASNLLVEIPFHLKDSFKGPFKGRFAPLLAMASLRAMVARQPQGFSRSGRGPWFPVVKTRYERGWPCY